MRSSIRIVIFLFVLPLFSMAQLEPNYDESKVPEIKLPDPLLTFGGREIKNARQWEKKRRPELLRFFTENVYGEIPGKLAVSEAFLREQSDDAFDGAARRKQVELVFRKNKHELSITILMYLPISKQKVPLFLGYDFKGNHTIADDPEIFISEAWVPNDPSLGVLNHQLTEQSRGANVDRWPLKKILEAGFGLAVIYYGEVLPDKDDPGVGVQTFFYVDDQQRPADNEWGAIAAWAWGLSRALDYFESDDEVDASKVIVFGHSRLGKTSLWAGATDQRFAGVIANNSGCMGAALSKRKFGETIGRINRSFPHWFCGNFKNYNDEEQMLPVDQHEVIALIAPRPVYVASAVDDRWADPKGEFLGALYACPVYKLYGKTGIETTEMPVLNQAIGGTVSYHIRSGGHGVTDFDWEHYLRWAKKYIQ